MDCREATDRMAPWAEEQLSPGELDLFEEHLAVCAACQHLAQGILAQDLRPPAQPPLPPQLWAKMDERLAQELDRRMAPVPHIPLRKRRFEVGAPAAAVYALVLVLVLAWGVQAQARLQESQAQTAALKGEMEREKRLTSQPVGDPPQAYRLTTRPPSRGMF